MLTRLKRLFKDMNHEKRIVTAAGRLDALEKTERDRPVPPETVDCETCGCMVRKEKAVPGESVVRKRPYDTMGVLCFTIEMPSGRLISNAGAEYIHTPHYCRRCAPKKKKAGS